MRESQQNYMSHEKKQENRNASKQAKEIFLQSKNKRKKKQNFFPNKCCKHHKDHYFKIDQKNKIFADKWLTTKSKVKT